MYMRCYGYNHFSKCIEEAKYFICASKHKGSKHEYIIESYSKQAELYKHYIARCANC
jgi:hypothetical protein